MCKLQRVLSFFFSFSFSSLIYLSPQFFVGCAVGIWTVERLLQKGEQDGNDDDRLQRLSEDDEEDGD